MMGALPARFRRARVLIVGCGDVGQRVLPLLRTRAQVLIMTRHQDALAAWRARGVRPLVGDLDHVASLQRLAGVATHVMYLAPPAATEGVLVDTRMRHWLQALRRRTTPRQSVYVSTSGVYGDCGGAWVKEQRVPSPQTPRAQRRVDAERGLRAADAAAVILRAPGIYALDRDGGTPERRLRAGTPVLCPEDDVFTNHIHAEDLARACVLGLRQRARGRTFNVSDDSGLTMGAYFRVAARLLGLAEPPQVSRAEAQQQLPAQLLSFMSESRRLDNHAMKQRLGLVLRYPTVDSGLRPPAQP